MSGDGANFAVAMRRYAMAVEAAASVSLSHPAKCDCVVCQAAQGDPDALAQVMAVIHRMDELEGGP